LFAVVQELVRKDTVTTIQRSVDSLLLEVGSAQADLQMQVEFEETTGQVTASTLNAAGDAAGTLHLLLACLGARMEELQLEMSGEKSGRVHLEQLLLAEKQRVGELEGALVMISKGAEDVRGEFAALEHQMRQSLIEKAVFDGQVIIFLGC